LKKQSDHTVRTNSELHEKNYSSKPGTPKSVGFNEANEGNDSNEHHSDVS